MAANGQEMKVDGEKLVKFKAGEQTQCGLNFLVTDVKKPLAAVSSIVDGGNVVIFGPGPWGSFIQNCASGEKIFMERKKGTYVIKVEYPGARGTLKKNQAPRDDGGRRAMEIGAAEKMTEEDEEAVKREAVFRGRM